MNNKRKLRCERLAPNFADTTFLLDFKGPVGTGGNQGWILVCVESKFRLVSFNFVTDTTAKTTSNVIMTQIFANFGPSCTIVTDRGSHFVNKLNAALFDLGSCQHHVTSAYRPQAEACEGWGVRALSKAMKSTLFNKPPSKLKGFVKYLQYLVNSMATHPMGGSPFEMLFGSKHSVFHPALEDSSLRVTYPNYFEERFKFMQNVTQFFQNKYDIMLSRLRSKRHTVHSLKIFEGSKVFYRVHQYPVSAKHIKTLLPRFRLGTVTKILGPTSLILEDIDSGRKISRHLVDVYKCQLGANFGNLYQTPEESAKQDCLEEETDVLLNTDQIENLSESKMLQNQFKNEVDKKVENFEERDKIEHKKSQKVSTPKHPMQLRRRGKPI